MKKKFFKFGAKAMLVALTYQLVFPACAYALTTGPSQPEVQSFEPVGTTEMVDMFTGDFNYNIPLMDVEGYPINIFYHSGVGMEQEASWVGLGWNINPGEINRSVRGLPDDFNGDRIEKNLYIKDEKDIRVGIGANVATEIFGKELNLKLSLGTDLYIAHNNYRGLSSGISYSAGLKFPTGSLGIKLGVGTQTGADIDLDVSVSPRIVDGQSFGASGSAGVGYNSRSGLKDLSFSGSIQSKNADVSRVQSFTGVGQFATTIPIGLQNYVPVIANRVSQSGFRAQFKIGFANAGTVVSAYVEGSKSTIKYDEDGSLDGYGYLYLQESGEKDMLDFSREKDGVYNETVKNLPLSALTYDIYSVNGHGTGGMFRPFRNDIGTIHDPMIKSADKQKSNQMEGGVPGVDYGEIGDDFTWVNTTNESGHWPNVFLDFSRQIQGSLYENVFFKQAGELTYNQQQEATSVFNKTAHFLHENLSTLVGKGSAITGYLPNIYEESTVPIGNILWDNSVIDRSSRASNISYQTAEQAMSVPEMLQSKQIASHDNGVYFYSPTINKYNRYGDGSGGRKDKAHHISEFTQTMPDGRRYVYGIPALNNISREVTFSVDESTADIDKGYVNVGGNDKRNNNTGRDHFYSSTITPAHAHSYLLTALLSADYVDILGDGPTDDDLGTYVKYNYSRKSNDYRWRAPYESDKAQYNPGFWSDDKDGKGNYVVGSREQWIVRTIETKNYIAEFYTSARNDSKGILSAITTTGDYSTSATTGSNLSYKLDEIKLYNKHDRHINKSSAIPVKTVIFRYNYSLCKEVPNNGTSGGGKLTLEKIFIKYGNSQKNLLSPYVFEYNGQNPNYNFAAKDRWGNYKKVVSGIHNYEFPYTEQPDAVTDQDELLASWNLTDIKLPSGGKIHVDYESDDYSFVQDKRSMQMLHISGVGRSKVMIPQNHLYSSESDINKYIYFKRRAGKENSVLSLKDNYFEGQDMLYYSFALDVANAGKFEPIKGYAKIEEVGICDGDPSYGYVKVKNDLAKNLELHPATIMGINTGRYYIPHIFYDGYSSETAFDNLKNLLKAFPELVRTIGGENPFKHFVKRGKAKSIKISNSWIKVQTPGLTKRGGGIRVKKLELSDNWQQLSGNEESKYGKVYDYTINHDRYGNISSGVASYEPMIGADENPFRKPVPYSVEAGKLIPSIDFFQEEPFGESFFPSASVGYSSVKVSSIHQQYGRSAQALDEYLFYTAKDYPVKVDYTHIDPRGGRSQSSLRIEYKEAKARQGYCLQMNDMHGKAKAVNNYVIHKDAVSGNVKKELITGKRFYYNEDPQHNLNNMVKSLLRKRGTQNTFELKEIILGQDMDFCVDSRYRSSYTTTNRASFNINVLQILGVPTPIPTFWTQPPTENTKKFQSLVTTKIIQQYGILKAIETIDHGAKTITENLVYDAETGNPLLTRTSNEFNEYTCNLTHPAYLAYEGMRPAYTNDAYEEKMDSLVVGYDRNGYLYTNNFDRFSKGDELLVKTKEGLLKLWVIGTGVDLSKGPEPDQGEFSFAKVKNKVSCISFGDKINVNVYNAAGAKVASGSLDEDVIGTTSVIRGDDRAFNLKLDVGNYTYKATGYNPTSTTTGSFTITKGSYDEKRFEGTICPDFGNIIVKKVVESSLVEKKDSQYDIIGLPTSYSFKGYIVHPTSGSTFPSIQHCHTQTGPYFFKYTNGGLDGYFATIIVVKDLTTEVTIHQNFMAKPTVSTAYIAGSACNPELSVPPVSKGTTSGSGPSSDALSKKIDVSTSEGTVNKRCALLVAPRFKDKFSGGTNVSTWPVNKTSFKSVLVKVLRSGRHNNLNNTIQQTSFAAVRDNFDDEHSSSLSKLFDKSSNVLSTSVQTYNDEAQMYTPFLNEMDISGDYKYGDFNPYVLGMKGNYRLSSTFSPITGRSYNQHTRTDGTYSIPDINQFWSINNGRAVESDVCDGPTDLFAEKSRTGNQFWKMASKITRYDIYGNALEEQDAIGNFSSAQYGYNKSLPVSVASNAKYQQFMFEGFEDYNMLLPEKIAALFLKADQYSAFGMLYSNSKFGSGFSMYDQKYFLRDLAPVVSTIVLTKTDNHSGYFSMKANSATSFTFNVGDASATEIGAFKFAAGKKYLIQLWAKSTSSTPITDGMFTVNHNSISTDMKVKTGSIDGWYQVEAFVDISSSPTLNLGIPANVYVDDLRALPIKSNMKSFVYDPISFKLLAQLDENHFATFFEYDQEGLLVRTKKETSKGIVTISESRRANYKKANISSGSGSTGGGEETIPGGETE
ncbi:MAG: hypothetical protein V4561_01540 [Bacteroidota bacterium]